MSIQALKSFFRNRQDIAFAFLFGSQARGDATARSDIDIAVYFFPHQKHPLEIEEEVFYESEGDVQAELEKLLKREVELLILNRASASIAASALRGIPLAVNDWNLFLDFAEVVTSEAEDFMDFVIDDYWERTSGAERG